jgi:hypothetical protein
MNNKEVNYDKQLILDFIAWCASEKNILLLQLENEYFREDELVQEYLEDSD